MQSQYEEYDIPLDEGYELPLDELNELNFRIITIKELKYLQSKGIVPIVNKGQIIKFEYLEHKKSAQNMPASMGRKQKHSQ